MIPSVTPQGPSLPHPGEFAVVFRFPDTSEVRYLAKPPAPGARVRSSAGERFVVARLVASSEHVLTAYCVAPAVAPARPVAQRAAIEAREDESGNPGAMDDLANHLLGVVRRTLNAPARLRRRYRMRHYIP
jgi:hypothetical protein